VCVCVCARGSSSDSRCVLTQTALDSDMALVVEKPSKNIAPNTPYKYSL